MSGDLMVGLGGELQLTSLPSDLADRAAELVLLTAKRLADPEQVARAASAPGNEEPVTGLLPWQGAALSHGHPGIAVFLGELTRRDDSWSAAADAHLRAALAAMAESPSDGLFLGPAAVAAAAQACSAEPSRYHRLRTQFLSWVANDQLSRIELDVQRRREGGRGAAWRSYDVINGLSGTGRLLLDAVATGPAQDEAANALTATLRHLVHLADAVPPDDLPVLAQPGTGPYPAVPGWWVPPELEPVEQDRLSYPNGDLNLGLAHGVSGPLTLLSLAGIRGLSAPGQRDAVERAAQWLMDWTMADEHGTYWPCRVSLEEELRTAPPPKLFTRTAWCYGAPGVALALCAAAGYLGRDDWRAAAAAALRDALRRPEKLWHLDGPTLCHGHGGLLTIVARVAAATGDPELADAVPRLAGLVLDSADEDAPFVFPHLTPDAADGWRSATRHKALAVAGLSEGAAGVACSLLDLIPVSRGDADAAALLPLRDGGWDRTLMLG